MEYESSFYVWGKQTYSNFLFEIVTCEDGSSAWPHDRLTCVVEFVTCPLGGFVPLWLEHQSWAAYILDLYGSTVKQVQLQLGLLSSSIDPPTLCPWFLKLVYYHLWMALPNPPMFPRHSQLFHHPLLVSLIVALTKQPRSCTHHSLATSDLLIFNHIVKKMSFSRCTSFHTIRDVWIVIS